MVAVSHAGWLRRGLWVAVVIALLVLVSLIVFTAAGHLWFRTYSDVVSDAYRRLRLDLRAAGAWGPILSIAAVAAHGILPVPIMPVLLVQVAVFGSPWGAVYAWIGLIAAAYVGYAMARVVGRPLIRRIVPLRYLVQTDRFVRRQGAFGLVLLRVLPFPFDPVSYAAGLAGIHPFTFGWATAIGVIPGVVLTDTVIMGLKHGHRGSIFWVSVMVLLIGGGLALIKARYERMHSRPLNKS